MAEHSYAWNVRGYESFFRRIGETDGEPWRGYTGVEFLFDEEIIIADTAAEVYDVDAAPLLDSAVKWGQAIEKLQDCLTRMKAVEAALEESWEGSASLRMQESIRQAEARVTYAIELLELPTALANCVGKCLKEYQAAYRKIPYTDWYYPKYGEHIYLYGTGSVPDPLWEDKNAYSHSGWCVTDR